MMKDGEIARLVNELREFPRRAAAARSHPRHRRGHASSTVTVNVPKGLLVRIRAAVAHEHDWKCHLDGKHDSLEEWRCACGPGG